MRANRRTDTKPELAVRSQLHRAGFRFRKDHLIHAAGVRVKPDVVFTSKRIAVFVDGCFWHRCPVHGKEPATHTPYWEQKLDRNVARDREVDNALRSEGWKVIRAWEHEPPTTVLERVMKAFETVPER